MSWSLRFVIPPGTPTERAAAASAAFLPVLDQQRPFGEQAVQVLHNFAAAASAAARGLDCGRGVLVQTSGHIGPNGGDGNCELHVSLTV